MRALASLVTVLLLAACEPGPLEHQSSLSFGDVALGQSRRVALLVRNSGSAPLTLAVEVTGEFSLESPARPLGGGESATLLITFTPADLGPRAGTLALRGPQGDSQVLLDGRGTGARIVAPPQVVLPPSVLVNGQPPQPVSTTFTLRNAGTGGSSLQLGVPRVEGEGLCVGTFSDTRCQPWSPPEGLAPESLLQVPLSALLDRAGPQRWTVVFPSDDVLQPELRLEVLGLAEAVEPCALEAPLEVVLRQSAGTLRLTHTGPGTCLIRALTLSSTPDGMLEFTSPLSLPIRLESGVARGWSLRLRPPSSAQVSGFVQVDPAGSPALSIPVRVEPPSSSCLVLTPSSLDFGTVSRDCNSANRHVQLYNACSAPLTILSAQLGSAAGEGPGGPNCPGLYPCPEFFVVSGIPANTVIQPGAVPVLFTLKYRPLNYGPDTGAFVVTTGGGLDYVLALQGRGDATGQQTDTFRQDAWPITDFLVMVDSSPSFVPQRAAVRTNLSALLTGLMNRGCVDLRWGFAAADGDPDAGVELLVNDAGERWSSSLEASFVERALSAFDALPVGSEQEACIGPAAALLQDAGVRDGGFLAGLCITDALEHSASPLAALQAFQRLRPSSTWSAITALGSSACAVEEVDDGTHAALVNASNGVREDICTPSWSSSLLPLGTPTCGGYRQTFFLTSRPDGTLTVTIDGQPSPSGDWSYDATNNAVAFAPGKVPSPGQTVQVSYGPACIP